jgi:hypothetical protein
MTTSATDAARSTARRRGIRRTAWTVGAIALLVYLAFIASGVFAWRGL